MKRIIFSIMTVLLCVSSLIGQTNNIVILDVAGLTLDIKYTDTQVRSKLGQPFKYKPWSDELGSGREYRYGPTTKYDLFRFSNEEGLISFVLENSTFKLFNGRLKVGDNISKIATLNGGRLVNNGGGKYTFFFANHGDLWIDLETNSSGIIQLIMFSLPN